MRLLAGGIEVSADFAGSLQDVVVRNITASSRTFCLHCGKKWVDVKLTPGEKREIRF